MRTVDRPERPYLGQKELDDLMRMNSELLAELWILRDRVTVLEHMLQEKSVIDRKQLNEYVPQGDLAKELERERAALIERVAGAPHTTSYTFESLARQADVG
jgi:hypothetical protein